MNSKIDKITVFQSLRESFIPNVRLGIKSASTSFFLPKLSRFINKKLYQLGLGSALNRYDNSFTIYSARRDADFYNRYCVDDIFCTFGSGSFSHNRWINYDYPGQSDYYKAIQGKENIDFFSINLCVANLALPHEDNSVSLIYCSHTLEHLELHFGKKFLEECHRILKDGGIMRIAVPSTDNDHKIASIINSQEKISIHTKGDVCAQVAHHILTDSISLGAEKIYQLMVNSGFDAKHFYKNAIAEGVSSKFSPNNPERHIAFWNYSALLNISKELSFKACIPLYRGASLAQPFLNLNVFDTTEPQISLYVELVK